MNVIYDNRDKLSRDAQLENEINSSDVANTKPE